MATIKEILEKCNLTELKSSARKNILSDKGSKGDLISRLISGASHDKILEGLSNKQLQSILKRYRQPIGGSKLELRTRILSLIEQPVQQLLGQAVQKDKDTTTNKDSSYKKGHDFEKRVATWAKRRFGAKSVKLNQLANGLTVARPYEIDVHVQYEGSGFFVDTSDLWIECKNIKSSIKRKEILDLVAKAADVFAACNKGRMGFYFDRLAIVSTSQFDHDALAYAKQNDVLCVHFDGQKFTPKTNPDFEEDPSWLERLK